MFFCKVGCEDGCGGHGHVCAALAASWSLLPGSAALGAKLMKFRFSVSAALDKLCACCGQFSSTSKSGKLPKTTECTQLWNSKMDNG